MSIKTILGAACLSLSAGALADCQLQWDYESTHAEWIDGFRLYQSDALVGTIAPDQRSATCAASGLVPGSGPITMTAYRGTDESERSLPAVFDLTAPGLRIIISTP